MTKIEFIENKVATANPDKYINVTVDTAKTLESWKNSLFSYEWLDENKEIKTFEALSAAEADKRRAVDDALKNNRPIEKPVLGIGMLDNVEIGSGRAAFLTLATLGLKTIPVHIPKSNESDFKDFLADNDEQ
jgi:hypothetical protein